MTKEDALKKIQALLNVTIENGATETEARNALSLVHNLTLKYNVDVREVAMEAEIVEEKVSMGTKSLSPIQVRIAGAFATHFGVEILCVTMRDAQSLKVIGEPVKVQSFVASYKYAYNAFMTLWRLHSRHLDMSTSDKNLYRGTFLKGFVDGITNEYIKNENQYGLVLSKSAALTDHMQKYKNLQTTRSCLRTNGDAHAYAHGYAAGSSAMKNKNSIGD